LQHYVVCYGYDAPSDSFTMADPAKGIVQYSQEELEKIWQSKACLTLEPNDTFIKAADTKKAKRQWIIQLIKEDYPLLGIAMALGVAMAIFSQKLIDDILPENHPTIVTSSFSLFSFQRTSTF
jgi:ATP-binding cassette, subfamily C, bacteriocin exporter